MLLVHIAKDGALELNWMWLPTFIGQNYAIMRELQKVWKEKFTGATPDEETLWKIHGFTIDWLVLKFPIPGLRRYLSAIEGVHQ